MLWSRDQSADHGSSTRLVFTRGLQTHFQQFFNYLIHVFKMITDHDIFKNIIGGPHWPVPKRFERQQWMTGGRTLDFFSVFIT